MPVRPNKYNADGEPRGRGRPKKGEIVTKRFMVHDLDNVKEELRLLYANETIRNAKNMYRKYNLGFPNPLNIDVKDLSEEARSVWKYIFSLRGYTEEDAMKEAKFERVFRDADEVIFAFESYVDYIKKNNYVKEFARPDGNIGVMPIIPNQTNLARWLGVRRCVVNNAILGDDSAGRQYMTILADVLSEGAMAGVYQAGSTQFALKNMCDWADKYEDKSYKRDTTLAVEEANSLMQSLGYTREKAKLEAPKPLLESDTNG